MNGTFKLEGFAELERKLFALGSTRIANRIGKKALEAAAEPIRATAERLAPDDPATPVGLKQSIKFATKRRDDVVMTRIGIDPDVVPPVDRVRKRGKGAYRDPGPAGVAVMQEFGTEKMAANPFMRPAWDGHKDATPGRIGKVLGREIEIAAKKLA